MSTARIPFLVLTMFLAAVAASAQTAPPRDVVINSEAFSDENTGITRVINVIKSVNAEFAATKTELDSMRKQIEALEKDIQANSNVLSPEKLQPKIDHFDQLKIDFGRKQEDAKARFDSRYKAVVSPVTSDILTALEQYVKLKNYGIVFDVAKDENGLIVALGDEKLDITKDFIAYYNARPAGASPK